MQLKIRNLELSTLLNQVAGVISCTILRAIEDVCKGATEYELAAILTACISMTLFKTESRNGYNEKREEMRFRKNYRKLFGFDMPHGDTVHNVIEALDEAQVETLKRCMVQTLLEKNVFHKNRFRQKWFRVAVDGSGVVSFKHKHCAQCLHTTSKNGKVSYFHTVLDARLITSNGFSISLANVWIENPADEEYDKQDCERKAFVRLAKKLKQAYPRLPMIILADGLYPYQGFFDICNKNQWAYCLTFKDGNLPSVWQEVSELLAYQTDNHHQEIRYKINQKKGDVINKLTQIYPSYPLVTEIKYYGHELNWLECQETKEWTAVNDDKTKEDKTSTTHFVHITDLPIETKNIADTSHTGRLRWKIENEGFNTLKNGGYGMKHKWARKSYTALKNYFQFMQIGHLINQLMIKNTRFQKRYLEGKNHPTIQGAWNTFMAVMMLVDIEALRLEEIINTRIQCRFIS